MACLFLSEEAPLFSLFGEEDDDEDEDEDVEENSTRRHRPNERDEHLDWSHSAAPVRPTAARLLQTCRCAITHQTFRPGRLDPDPPPPEAQRLGTTPAITRCELTN